MINPTDLSKRDEYRIKPTNVSSSTIFFSFRYLKTPASKNVKKREKFCLRYVDGKKVDSNQYAQLMQKLADYSRMDFQSIQSISHSHIIDFSDNGVSEKSFGVRELDEDRDARPFQLNITLHSGRVSGAFVGSTFFVVWVDFNHDLYPGK
jgi:hypothetical protein